ncbi:DUF6907 domain-containing protein [Streptomyces sp. NPDC001107]
MNAQDWKLSVTGDNCPKWCAGNHADEDPQHDAILHESAPLTVELPPLVNGEHLRLEFTTVCREEHRTQEEGRTPARVDLGFESDQQNALPDYVPVPSRQALDKLIGDLQAAVSVLEQWRDRLPSAA